MQTGNHEGAHDVDSDGESGTYDGLIGQTIAGNFRLLKRIGSGTMGTVFQAEQISLQKMVAVKIMRSELMADTKLIKRFELEARAASSLNHPNSIQIIDFGRHENLLYIAMELLAGIDLAQVLQREWPLPLHRIGRIMDQVLAALDEAHAQGIVHRDLKPGNIMLVHRRGESDFVKVCDFGIAKAGTGRERPNLTMKGFVFGTPEYMSPEQARGAETVDGRADLYAVSVILYQLIVGDIPFPAPSPVDILAKHLTEQPTPPSARGNIGIPTALEDLIMRGLAKRPDDRPQTAAEYREQLRQSLGNVVDGWSNQNTPLPVLQKTPPAVVMSGSSPGMQPPQAAVLSSAAPPTEVIKRKSRLWVVGLSALAAAGGGFWFMSRGDLQRTESFPFVAPAAPAVQPMPTATVAKPAPTVSPVEAPAEPTRPVAVEPAPSEEPAAVVAPESGDKSARDKDSQIANAKAARLRAERLEKERKARKVAAADPRGGGARHLSPDAGRAAESAPIAAPVAAAPVAAPSPSPAAPSGPAEVMKDAERLLAHGEVANACKKGEEVRRANPRLAAVWKFLGKCYMRAGKPEPAKDSYRKYLELSPDASDAAFIKSFLK